MLAGITALGERSRGRTWPITFIAFTTGSIAGGLLTGAALGGLGALAGVGATPLEYRLLIVVIVALAGGLLDLGFAGRSLPSCSRQVNAGWMTAYRGWLYGAGFGFQLGGGVSTVVIASATYVCLVCAALTATPAGGAAVVGAYGVVRGLSLIPGAFIRRPSQLVKMSTTLAAADAPARYVAAVSPVVVAAMAWVVTAA